MNQNSTQTTARPEDTAFNIQRGRPPMRTENQGPRSTSPSPMDNVSTSSTGDYAERVAALNNMEVDASQTPLLSSDVTSYNFMLPPSQPPRAPHEEALNSTHASEACSSTEPSPPTVIPYSANVPADPSLWDGNFTATSLFSTNEFLNSDIQNIACSLQRMACSLRQRNIKDHNGNNIRQLDPFGDSAWNFISAIFEAGWDQLITSDDTSIRDNIASKFGKVKVPPIKGIALNDSAVKKIPSPIPPRLSKKELEKAKNCMKNASGRRKDSSPLTYAQATLSASNILKIKEAFQPGKSLKYMKLLKGAKGKLAVTSK